MTTLSPTTVTTASPPAAAPAAGVPPIGSTTPSDTFSSTLDTQVAARSARRSADAKPPTESDPSPDGQHPARVRHDGAHRPVALRPGTDGTTEIASPGTGSGTPDGGSVDAASSAAGTATAGVTPAPTGLDATAAQSAVAAALLAAAPPPPADPRTVAVGRAPAEPEATAVAASSSSAGDAPAARPGSPTADPARVPAPANAPATNGSPATATSLSEALAADPTPIGTPTGLPSDGASAAALTSTDPTPASPSSATFPSTPGAVPGQPIAPATSGSASTGGNPADAGANNGSGNPASSDPRPGQPLTGSATAVGNPAAAAASRPVAVTPATISAAAAGEVAEAASNAATATLLASTGASSAAVGLPAVTRAATDPASTRTAATLPSHVAELARMARISADGTARLTVRLDPPELGAVTLHLTSRGSAVELSIRAETPAGAVALAGQQNRVRDLLAGHGFDLSHFSIAGAERSGSLGDPSRGRDNPTGDFRGNDPRSTNGGAPADGRGNARSGSASSDGFSGESGRDRSGSRSSTGLDGGSAATPRQRTAYPSTAANEGTWL